MSKQTFWETAEDIVGLAVLVFVCLVVYHL